VLKIKKKKKEKRNILYGLRIKETLENNVIDKTRSGVGKSKMRITLY